MTSSPSQTFETIPVQLGHYTYPIILGDGILSQLPELCNKYNVGKKVMIITNPVLMRLYALQIRQYFKQAGYECQFIEVPEGEASKCMSEVNRLLTFLLKYQMERQDTILALGGGVIGDLAGFVASIYLRGIHLIQVPTTLLSQVDSAIGGKTGVNHEMGKNLIGSFYHPKFTFIDTQTLSSLPKREIRCGLAEVIKYGLISTPELFTYIETNIDEIKRFDIPSHPACWRHLISVSCQAKVNVVCQDEKESNLRAILNFGHTIGHALESCSEYGVYHHGEAIAIGMLISLRLSVNLGLIDEAKYQRVHTLFETLGFEFSLKGLQPKVILNACQVDKKVKGGLIHWIIATDIGKVEIRNDIDHDLVLQVLTEWQGQYK
ncbi:MAG: 3-dehydroquinate synthase [Actinobacteria bacterium]|nr:3-dehydroquinate synthase [Actinomycetota bacterium]